MISQYILRPEGESMVSIYVIDRLACDYNYETVRNEFEHYFKIPLSIEDYNHYKTKYSKEITARRDEIRELIYKSGAYSKLIDVSNRLYDLVLSGGSPKEISSVAATLRGYLESMQSLGRAVQPPAIKQQNNFLVLKSLEKDGLISIHDEKRLQYLIDPDAVVVDSDINKPKDDVVTE